MIYLVHVAVNFLDNRSIFKLRKVEETPNVGI